ncbi:hypothetical protein AND_009922 [Anopheles darlingi]|uniref:Uncharacterized protein n=1 Tax=Anopheles darlingi TaxID=43151 RepID=W5J2K2_ANODA|nr:hypothetical protein AND_009922 [Anopheles darlingi]
MSSQPPPLRQKSTHYSPFIAIVGGCWPGKENQQRQQRQQRQESRSVKRSEKQTTEGPSSSALETLHHRTQAPQRCVAPHKNLPELMLVLVGGNCVAIAAGVCDGLRRETTRSCGAL